MNVWMKNEILKLKKEKNAAILAHYYAPAEVQELADFVGDSFYLAKVAKKSTADILVFCGVSFMGESAKLLNPDKKVLMPDPAADCPMAHMVAEGKIEEMRSQYDDLAVVCYINSSAELKAKSDVCVTSSNAVAIVRSLPQRNIFLIPDYNLGRFIAEQVPEKNIILNNGCCPIHAEMSAEAVLAEKNAHPNAPVLAHPECGAAVLALADFIGSTAEIIAFANQSAQSEMIICTEDGVAFQLQRDNPEKQFFFPKPVPCCEGMKRNTMQNLLRVLQTEENEITVAESLQSTALLPLDKMLELAR